MSSALRAGLTLPIYSLFKTDGKSDSFVKNMYTKIGVSFLTSVTLSFIVYPLDTAKRCMQLNGSARHTNKFKNSNDCLQQIMAKGGLPALYRGVGIFALKEMFVAFTQVSMYDLLFSNVRIAREELLVVNREEIPSAFDNEEEKFATDQDEKSFGEDVQIVEDVVEKVADSVAKSTDKE